MKTEKPKLNTSEIFSWLEYHIIWPKLFERYKANTRPDEKTVLFADSYSQSLTENMIPIYNELSKKGGYTLLTSFPSRENGLINKLPKILRKIFNRIRRSYSYIDFLKKYAQCGTLILTESYLPAYAVQRPKDTKVIQLWHGCGAFKKWGYSTLDNSFGASRKSIEAFPMHNCYTLVPVSSSNVSFAYREAFHMEKNPECIKPLGVPYTDIYYNQDFIANAKENLCRYCIRKGSRMKNLPHYFDGKKVILYAPTFRGTGITNATGGSNIDIEKIHEFLGEDYIFLIKLHPFAKDRPEIPRELSHFACDISDVSTAEALAAADLLITDYSSIIFEYSLLKRPMLFFPYDLDSYIDERGFYYPYKEFVPGLIAYNQEDLQKYIKSVFDGIDKTIFNEEIKKSITFKEKYMSACAGHSTENIIRFALF